MKERTNKWGFVYYISIALLIVLLVSLILTPGLFNTFINKLTGFAILSDGSVVNRSFSSSGIHPGDKLNITINVFIGTDPNHTMYLIEETFPLGWNLTSDGNGTVTNNTLRWSYLNGSVQAVSTQYIYSLIAPSNTTVGTYNFSGSYWIEDMENESDIEGSTQVNVTALICTFGTNQTRQCGVSSVGACRYGNQTSSCLANNTWGPWGACIGEVDPTNETCNNIDDDCDGSTDESLINATSCGLGICSSNTGSRTCSAGVWGADTCSPFAGAHNESCNGLDDDCDGTTDENLTNATTCGVGRCSGNSGSRTCSAGSWGADTCSPFAGAINETCNNIDDDCDGTTDENLTNATTCGVGRCSGNTGSRTCSAGNWSANTCNPLSGATTETCNNIDDDCDGTTDENLTNATTCGVGRCSGNTGSRTCSAGNWSANTCNPFGNSTTETCNTLDDDCNGVADNNLTITCSVDNDCNDANASTADSCTLPGSCASSCTHIPLTCVSGNNQTRQCGVSSVGACRYGNQTSSCLANNTWGPWGACIGEVDPTNETCNNIDDDCDGTTDENLSRSTSCGVGICSSNTGTETCSAGSWGSDTCNPLAGATTETCNNLDDDCDGTTDESLTNITLCGVGICSLDSGSRTCTLGVWSADTCNPFASATNETCNGLDDNCDGTIDENLTTLTTCGTGICSSNTGNISCVGGVLSADTCNPLFGATAEICGNSLDDDCDGAIDEGCTVVSSSRGGGGGGGGGGVPVIKKNTTNQTKVNTSFSSQSASGNKTNTNTTNSSLVEQTSQNNTLSNPLEDLSFSGPSKETLTEQPKGIFNLNGVMKNILYTLLTVIIIGGIVFFIFKDQASTFVRGIYNSRFAKEQKPEVKPIVPTEQEFMKQRINQISILILDALIKKYPVNYVKQIAYNSYGVSPTYVDRLIKLKEYMDYCIMNNLPKEKIIANLLSTGWSKEIVYQLFNTESAIQEYNKTQYMKNHFIKKNN